MPILIPVEDTGSDLAQGDVLKGRSLYRTGIDGNARHLENRPYCLVVSRRCAAVHGTGVLVVAIRDFGETIPQAGSFDDIETAFILLRDGATRTDTFYLGNLPGQAARLVAKLNEWCIIEVPQDHSERGNWIAHNRVARLHSEFIPALWTRCFWTMAKAGFHDYEWFATKDLEYLVAVGENEKDLLTEAVSSVNRRLKAEKGKPTPKAGALDGLRKELKVAEEKLDGFVERFERYKNELESRSDSSESTD
jgi:hypothetical protein